MTSYSSQLKGWAVDRVIKLYESNPEYKDNVSKTKTVDDLIAEATKLAAFCYEADEDINQLEERLAELKYNKETTDAINMDPVGVAQ